MFVYNVTIKVSHAIADKYVAWLKDEHIPEVVGTGCFTEGILHHLLDTDDEEGKTYSVRYLAESKADLNRYLEINADGLRKKSYEKWGDQFIAFRTIMQIVQ